MIKLNRPPCPKPEALVNKNYKHSVNKAALENASSGKCMYCESYVTHIDFGDVEHIKPKAPDKFPHLEFEWSNLGFSCGKCNQSKSQKYFADTPFIDPYNEDPSEHLCALGAFLSHRNGSVRGEVTIKEIDLNRPELLEKRMTRIDNLTKAIDAAFRSNSEVLKSAAIQELLEESQPDKEYSLICQFALSAHGLGD